MTQKGGARPGAGRKKIYKEPGKTRSVRVPHRVWERVLYLSSLNKITAENYTISALEEKIKKDILL